MVNVAIEKVIRAQGHHYPLRTMTVDERLDSYIAVQRLTALLSDYRNLLSMVLREALVLAASGCAMEVLVSLGVGSFIKSVLFGVSPNDPASIIFALAVMLAVAGAPGGVADYYRKMTRASPALFALS